MNVSLEHRAAGNGNTDFDHRVLAELIARRWKQERGYFALNKSARGAWLEASWWRQPNRSALQLHWSHRAAFMARADLFSPPQTVFEGAA